MLLDAARASYRHARACALRSCAELETAASMIERARERLRTYLGIADADALRQARRGFLHAGDAVFHDQLLATERVDVLRALVEAIEADSTLPDAARHGAVAVSLHYGPATSILPLWLAAASRQRMIGRFAVIQNSRSNPSVMLSQQRLADLRDGGLPVIDLDIARLGELGALRHALTILKEGGVVMIFADGQLPPRGKKHTINCRLGRGSLALPQGPDWLARSANVPVLPLLIRPDGDSHRVAALPAVEPQESTGAIQALLDIAMRLDPAPWARWCSEASHF
jgi:hypothetical protein